MATHSFMIQIERKPAQPGLKSVVRWLSQFPTFNVLGKLQFWTEFPHPSWKIPNPLLRRPRIRASFRKESGAWLNALPCSPMGTLPDNDTPNISLYTPGNRNQEYTYHPHTCRCGASVNESGTHGLSCQKNAGRISRHIPPSTTSSTVFAFVHVPVVLEPSGVYRDDGKRPNGVTLSPWSKDKYLLWMIPALTL
jgi:hypothetical protein